MRLKNEIKTDVLVMGAGLAGIMAAISAAEAGAGVCIVSSADICSGSSFYPGTWGLGLIGPEKKEDEADLKKTILEVGEGMADPSLAEVLVSHIRDGISYLEDMGVRLKEAEQKEEAQFIPCFDHKNRDWHGIVKDSARQIFQKRLDELGVIRLSHTHIIQCIKTGERVTGAVAVSEKGGVSAITCRSLIIASGGLGGLFQYRLNTSDVTGMGQYMALLAGAKLVNLEFMQMMPGYIKPAPRTIYNEKVFKYSNFCCPGTETSIFEDWDKAVLAQRMEVRSTHGPFTSRLLSAPVDIRLFSEFLNHPEGVTVSYQKALKENQPEFIRTYFEWLEKEKHLTIDDSIQLGIFAHASNGGICIDSHGRTGVPGLFACGEATGGMHGADRLGGLSTANGLVFGRIAGREAARDQGETVVGSGREIQCPLFLVPDAQVYLREIQELNFKCTMVIRNGKDTEAAIEKLAQQKRQIYKIRREFVSGDKEQELIATYRLFAALALSECLRKAVLLREESRGSHYRADYPEKREDLSFRIISSLNGEIKTQWENSL